MRKNKSYSAIILLAIFMVSVLRCASTETGDEKHSSLETIASTPSSTIEPIDNLITPKRGFYKGFASLLPIDDSFENSHEKAAEHAEFVNIWVGAPDAGYWNLAEYLEGSWGDNFVESFVRENGMVPIINMSFIDKDPVTGQLILKIPEGKKTRGNGNDTVTAGEIHFSREGFQSGRESFFRVVGIGKRQVNIIIHPVFPQAAV